MGKTMSNLTQQSVKSHIYQSDKCVINQIEPRTFVIVDTNII